MSSFWKSICRVEHLFLFRWTFARIISSLIILSVPFFYGRYVPWTLDQYYKAYSMWGLICATFNFIIIYHQKILLKKYMNVNKLIEKYDSPYLLASRDYSRKHLKDKDSISQKELLEKLNNEEEFERSVIYLFNFWEVVYRMIEYDMIDNNFAKKYFCTPFLSNYEFYRPWVTGNNTSKAKDTSGVSAINSLYEMWRPRTASTPEA